MDTVNLEMVINDEEMAADSKDKGKKHGSTRGLLG